MSARKSLAIALLVAAVLAVPATLIAPGAGEAQVANDEPAATYRITLPGLQSDKPAPPPPTPTPQPYLSPASAEGLRVWSNGDSTSYFMTVALLSILESQGAVPVVAPDYVISSGLMSPGYFDWPAHLAAQMATHDPDVVVFMVGANDAAAQPDLALYRERTAATMDLLERPGRIVLWVGQPTMDPARRPDLATVIPGVNAVFREEAAKREWVRYVDAYRVTSAPGGGYAAYLPGEGGAPVLARAADGVHLTGAGGRIIALEAIRVLFEGE